MPNLALAVTDWKCALGMEGVGTENRGSLFVAEPLEEVLGYKTLPGREVIPPSPAEFSAGIRALNRRLERGLEIPIQYLSSVEESMPSSEAYARAWTNFQKPELWVSGRDVGVTSMFYAVAFMPPDLIQHSVRVTRYTRKFIEYARPRAERIPGFENWANELERELGNRVVTAALNFSMFLIEAPGVWEKRYADLAWTLFLNNSPESFLWGRIESSFDGSHPIRGVARRYLIESRSLRNHDHESYGQQWLSAPEPEEFRTLVEERLRHLNQAAQAILAYEKKHANLSRPQPGVAQERAAKGR